MDAKPSHGLKVIFDHAGVYVTDLLDQKIELSVEDALEVAFQRGRLLEALPTNGREVPKQRP